MNDLNITLSTDLQSLWSSYLENQTSTNDRMQSDYESLMDYINQSFDLLTQKLDALDAYVRALNASYAENLSLIEAYMAFTNASIDLLTSELLLLSDTQKNDTSAILADLDNLSKAAALADDALWAGINSLDGKLSGVDNDLNSSIQELQAMTAALSARADSIENSLNRTNQTQTDNLNAEMLRLNFLVSSLREEMNANQTKLETKIIEARTEGLNNLAVAALIAFIAGTITTWVGVTVHERNHEGLRRKSISDEEE